MGAGLSGAGSMAGVDVAVRGARINNMVPPTFLAAPVAYPRQVAGCIDLCHVVFLLAVWLVCVESVET